ncbi:MAG: DUF1598 domain-containing protein [Planctomycetales bacterium]|nr:DUF1598 domain-containing protein [Planctomycetales bacterium]
MSRPRWSICAAVAAIACAFAVVCTYHAEAGRTIASAVGGIFIDADGAVRAPSADMKNARIKALREAVAKPAGDVNTPVELRRISLRGLEAAVREALAKGDTLPDEIQFLAGLQRIQYVFVYPEQNDIVIAGPAEGWVVNGDGEIVGITSGRPVLRLDDLLVALRSVENARTGGISCSIDPTAEGRQRLQQVLDAQARSRQPLNPAVLEPQMKEAFGPQQITVKGVPLDSHFARMLVAADYRMKRLAMHLEPAPIPNMPSYVQMIRGGVNSSTNPRWWLACNYEPLAASDDKLAWEIRGQGVKAMTEDEFVQADGTVKGTGKANDAAQKWADLLTSRYDELSAADPVFGKLRNMMDMCVVAALIEAHDFRNLANCDLSLLYDARSDLTLTQWPTPRTVSPECSFLRTRKGWTVTASGGVLVESWQSASRSKVDGAIAAVREKSAPNAKRWWWN